MLAGETHSLTADYLSSEPVSSFLPVVVPAFCDTRGFAPFRAPTQSRRSSLVIEDFGQPVRHCAVAPWRTRGHVETIAFNEYVNDDGTEVAVVQIHPDADSMAFHMEVIAERAAAAYAETVDATTSVQVFGMPSNAVIEMLKRQAGVGVPLTVKSSHLGGFTR